MCTIHGDKSGIDSMASCRLNPPTVFNFRQPDNGINGLQNVVKTALFFSFLIVLLF